MEGKTLTRFEENMLIFVTTLCSFVALINSTSINIALSTFMSYFDAPITTVQWVVVGYMLSTGLITPLVGFWGDQYSSRRLMLLSLVVLAIASVGCALAPNIELLIALRVVQGIAGGIIMPSAMTLIYQFVSKERQLLAMSISSMAMSAGVAIGPSLAGILINFFSWQSIFWVNVPLCALCFVLVLRYIPMKIISTEQKIDLPGLTAVTVGTVGLLLGFNQGESIGWTSPLTLGMIGVSVAALVYFVKHELRVPKPMLNFEVYRYPKYTYSVILSGVMVTATCLSPFYMPIFLQNVMGFSVFESGLALVFPSLVMAVGSPLASKLADHFSIRSIIFVAMALLCFSTWEMSRFSLATTLAGFTLWLSLRYLGIGVATPLINNFGMEAVPVHLVGHASAMVGWIRQLVMTLSTSIFAFIYSVRLANRALAAAAGESDPTVLSLAIGDVNFYSLLILLLCLPVVYFFKEGRRAQDQNEAA